jgi:hypothetical protein
MWQPGRAIPILQEYSREFMAAWQCNSHFQNGMQNILIQFGDRMHLVLAHGLLILKLSPTVTD